jgi:type II secretory pathway component GspD/PulD (secretin)
MLVSGTFAGAQLPAPPPPPLPPPTTSRPLPAMLLTQLDERAASAELDNRTFSLTFVQPQPIKEALLLVVRGTSLSLASDPEVGGTFSGDLKNVTVRQALDAMLPPLGLTYSVDGSLVRVFRRAMDTRIFDLNYIAAERIESTTIRGGDVSSVAVATTTRGDVFAELTAGVRALLSPQATFNVDRKVGLLQVSDTPERLDRVAVYLEAVQDRIHRQAQIDVRVLEVTLNDERSRGVDWTALMVQLSGDQSRTALRPTLTAMRVTNIARLVTLLEAQGSVVTVSNPRLMVMNNEPALLKTDAITLAITAQISGDAQLTLSLSPMVRAPATAESNLLARVADGETLVVTGAGIDRETREQKTTGSSWFGHSSVTTRRRVEVVILFTPRIVTGSGAQ